MFLQLFTIEWTRLSRRSLLWLMVAACALYTGMGIANFYQSSRTALMNGSLRMPGMAFDLANALDQLIIAVPFFVIIAANQMGNDYTQRTNQRWLMHGGRASSLLAKFTLLVVLTVIIQVITLLVGWAVGAYYKAFVYHAANLNNVDWLVTFAAPFYMTVAFLPYIALMLLITVLVRSTFVSVVLGLGYTLIVEFLLAGFFHVAWTKWLITNLHFSATFLLNAIGNRTVNIGPHLLAPMPALVTSALYTLVFLALAIWHYRRQDVGG